VGAALHSALGLIGAAGAVLLVVATFTTVIEVKVGNVTKDTLTGYDRHSVAFIIIAVFAAMMLVGALRGARPPMVAVAVSGIVAILITVIGDAPDIHETGAIGALYEQAVAGAGVGFYLETLGGVLLLLSGGAFLLLGWQETGTPTIERSEPHGQERLEEI
jgi:amino acid transporter